MPPALLISMLFAGLVAAPQPAAAAGAGADGELTIGITQFPSHYHPSIDAMAAKGYVQALARRPVTAYGADWQLTCLTCTELPSLEAGTAQPEARPDGRPGLAVTYTLKEGLRWGDGVPVTSADALFTWQAGRHPLSGFTDQQFYARDIADLTVIDDRRFTLHLDKRVCEYQGISTFELLPAHLERPVFEAAPGEYRTRTRYQTEPTNPGLWFGPYRPVEIVSGSHFVFEPNPTWGGQSPAFKRIVVKAVENSAALEANLLAGDVDMIPGEIGLPLDQALALERRHGGRFDVQTKAGLFYEHLDMNLDNPALADVRVRRALLLALDRETLVRQLFAGRQPVADGVVSPLDTKYDPDHRRYPFDPAEAARLLDEAGWPRQGNGIRTNAKGERLTFDLMTTAGNRSRELVQQVIQAQWRQIGVDSRIENQPARVLFGQTLRERRFTGLALFAWLSSPGSIPRTSLHSSQIPSAANGFSGQNLTGYRNPDLDRVIDALETECEPKANRDLWTQLQRIYADDLPALPLYLRAEATIKPHWLTGVNPTGHQFPSTLWVETWGRK